MGGIIIKEARLRAQRFHDCQVRVQLSLLPLAERRRLLQRTADKAYHSISLRKHGWAPCTSLLLLQVRRTSAGIDALSTASARVYAVRR